MRLPAFLVAAIASSAISSTASAGSWGPATTIDKDQRVCLKVENKQVLLRGKKLQGGALKQASEKEIEKLLKSKKAVLMADGSKALWKGRVACVIGDDGKGYPDPNEQPKPDNSQDGVDHDSDPTDNNSGAGNDSSGGADEGGPG